MRQVEESLKSARLVHRMMMLVCATVLAVALHPSEQKNYSAAIDELEAIRKIDLAKFAKDSIQETNRLAKESEFAVKWAAGFTLLMRYELDQIGLTLEESDARILVFCAVFDLEKVTSLRRTRLIRDYENFLIENIGINYVDFGAARIAEAFAMRMKDPNVLQLDFLPGTKLALMVFKMMPPSFDASETRSLTTEMSLAIQFAKLKRPPVEITISSPSVWGVYTFDGTRFQDWLKRQQLLEQLIEDKMPDGYYSTAEYIFPKLRPIWSLVADKVPEEAIDVLMEEAKKSRRIISFFGVEIPASMVVLTGPSLAFILFLYLLSYVKHIQTIYTTETNTLSTFPWLALFPYRVSRIVTFISILLLPPTVFCFLLFQFRHIEARIRYIGLLFTVLSVFMAYFSWRRILCLRKTSKEEKVG
jgi:hypothetical protein